MKKTKFLAMASVILVGAMLSGCTSERPAPTVTVKPSPTATSKPSATPKPSTSPTATPAPVETTPPVTPTPTPTTKPAPEPEPAPVVTSLVIGAQGLRVVDSAGTVVERLPYTLTPAQMRAELIDVFGVEPTSEFSGEENYCWYNMTTIRWDDFVITFSGQDLNNSKIYNVAGVQGKTNDPITVQSPSGAVVGGDYSKIRKNTPGKLIIESEYDGTTYSQLMDEHIGNFPKTEEDLYSLTGAGVLSMNNVVTGIVAPFYLYGDC
jgi:hypothetical protein